MGGLPLQEDECLKQGQGGHRDDRHTRAQAGPESSNRADQGTVNPDSGSVVSGKGVQPGPVGERPRVPMPSQWEPRFDRPGVHQRPDKARGEGDSHDTHRGRRQARDPRQQPTANDLRFLVTVMRVAHELERSADLSVNIAKTTRRQRKSPT